MQSVYLQRIMKKNAAKGYKKTKPKQTQFPKSQKMNANAFPQKDYENETAFRPKKTNPKQTQFLPRPKSLAKKSGHTRCRLYNIFGLQFGLIVAKYREICNHRFVSNNKAIYVVQ